MRRHHVVVLAVLLAPGGASAGGFAEAVVGAATPKGDDGYDALVARSMKYGLRAGWLHRLHRGDGADVLVGPEVGGDYTTLAEEQDFSDVGMGRIRAVAGARVVLDHGTAIVFARAGAGIDRIHVDFDDLTERLCGDPTVTGLALEGGVGFGVRLGHVVVGGQAGLSAGYHRDDRPACSPVGDDDEIVVDVLDNRDLDLDLLVFAGAMF